MKYPTTSSSAPLVEMKPCGLVALVFVETVPVNVVLAVVEPAGNYGVVNVRRVIQAEAVGRDVDRLDFRSSRVVDENAGRVLR
ncbi:MAG: hypothetical protein ACREML_07910 [Vulcanimicrobiaceae bacterium]